MSNNIKYLEIDSTYRNRNEYPNPADFIVFLSQSGTKNALNASDPVSLATPHKIWNPKEYESHSGKVRPNSLNTTNNFIVTYDLSIPPLPTPPNYNPNVSKIVNYYVGSPITVGDSTSIISKWDFLSTNGTENCFTVVVTPALQGLTTDIKVGDQLVKFSQGTDLITSPFIFIPNGINADNYYVKYIIYNQTKNQWRPVISYDGFSRLAGIDISLPYGPISWANDDTFLLRKELPLKFGAVSSILTSTTIKIPYNSSDNSSDYVGSFIRFTNGTNENKICLITNYDVITSSPPSSTQYIVITVNSILNIDTTPTYEILGFTRDNEVPFMYNGSIVSHQEMLCYEIELIDLTLPNKVLFNGGRTSFYPYIYVELQNTSAPGSGFTNIIYSNNPNSSRKLFRCRIDDIQNPLSSPFIKIDSDGTRQTIKFKPNDNLHFAVYLPNGELFRTLSPETYSPDVPNPFVQISALFSLKRI